MKIDLHTIGHAVGVFGATMLMVITGILVYIVYCFKIVFISTSEVNDYKARKQFNVAMIVISIIGIIVTLTLVKLEIL